MKLVKSFSQFSGSTVNEGTGGKKVKFVLYTNPGNSTSAGYVAIGSEDVREVLSDAKRYSDSYKILYQGSGTQADLLKAKQMFSDYRFGNESIDENMDESIKSSSCMSESMHKKMNEMYESMCNEMKACHEDETPMTAESYMSEAKGKLNEMMENMAGKCNSYMKTK
jgi:hypothetical protein